MRSARFLMVATLSGMFGIACSNADDGAAASTAAEDAVVVEATAATRASIGVASWGISLRPAAALVRGYDAERARIVSFEYRVSSGDAPELEATLDASGAHARLHVATTDATHVRVVEDSFSDSASGKGILARIVVDLRSQPARAANPSRLGPSNAGLLPLDGLTQGSASNLVEGCAGLVGTAAATGAEATARCSGGADAASCNKGIDDTKSSQRGGEQCKLDCSGPATAIDVAEVEIKKTTATGGEGAARGYIGQALDALCIKDAAARDRWTRGYLTLTNRESSFNPNAVNTSDSNATGATAADGNPQNCSRGLAQCIPTTFAAHHQPGTAKNVYDPVASIAASMNYVIAEYGVTRDGSNLSAKVRQADPGRGPGGY